MSEAMISMPVIATYEDVAAYLKLSKKTVYKMVCEGVFPSGVYIGHGRFNLTRLADHIDKHGSFLRKKAA